MSENQTGDEVALCPETMRILVMGPNVWGKGDTLDEALKNATNPRMYIAYIIHHDTTVYDDGSIGFPPGMHPKEIIRKETKKPK